MLPCPCSFALLGGFGGIVKFRTNGAQLGLWPLVLGGGVRSLIGVELEGAVNGESAALAVWAVSANVTTLGLPASARPVLAVRSHDLNLTGLRRVMGCLVLSSWLVVSSSKLSSPRECGWYSSLS